MVTYSRIQIGMYGIYKNLFSILNAEHFVPYLDLAFLKFLDPYSTSTLQEKKSLKGSYTSFDLWFFHEKYPPGPLNPTPYCVLSEHAETIILVEVLYSELIIFFLVSLGPVAHKHRYCFLK
jgi:hypothetical protein